VMADRQEAVVERLTVPKGRHAVRRHFMAELPRW
jgi:hypothetical protein